MLNKPNKETLGLSSLTIGGGQGAIFQKLKHYCNYQPRCHYEVRQKLFELKVSSKLHDEIITALIEGEYLNEERFAKDFARGKFRIKQWGRRKIQQELQQRQISSYLIKLAMKEIDDSDYRSTLYKLVKKKYASLKGEQYLVRKKKTIDHLLQKGYEPNIVVSAVNEVAGN